MTQQALPTSWPPQPPPPQPPQAPVPPRRPPRNRRLLLLAAGLALMFVIVAGTFLAGRATQAAQLGRAGTGAGNPVADVSAQVDPGVVDITTVLGYGNGAAAGTGIVLSADGLVLTNNHVVSGATGVSVTDVGNGRTYQASVVGYDRGADVAVVKL